MSGRTADQRFIEFSTLYPNFIPQPREYQVALKCKVGHREKWITVIDFPLHFENISAPGSYIAYSNAPNAIEDGKRDSARDELDRLASSAKNRQVEN